MCFSSFVEGTTYWKAVTLAACFLGFDVDCRYTVPILYRPASQYLLQRSCLFCRGSVLLIFFLAGETMTFLSLILHCVCVCVRLPSQALQKAPQNTAIGFRQTVSMSLCFVCNAVSLYHVLC